MKKNISINISGIIFHIEEDAFEKLRDYLDSINKYFKSFEDSQEIIQDIESRIAEIFLSKLNEDKQVINAEDIDSLINTMGSIEDFQAVEDQTRDQDDSKSSYEESTSSEWSQTGASKLYRDEQRRVFGGVCAGLAYYFKMDPLWIRLITVALFLVSYGTIGIAYLIMWAVVPASYELTDKQKYKKMYRNPNGKVIAGVSTGVASYFKVDVVVIRVLFVLFTVFGGAGLLVYIILWIILPEAKSVTDRVQMEGDPVTLSNIESNIKKGLNVNENEEENILVKILLFPFRLIATIITGLGKVLGPLLIFIAEFARILIGIVLIIIGASLVFSTVVTFFIIIGLISTDFWMIGGGLHIGFPVETFINSFPVVTAVAGFFALAIPALIFILLGSSLVAKRLIFSATTGWTLFALFIVSGIILSFNIPAFAFQFKEDGEFEAEQTFELNGKTAILELNEVGLDEYNVTTLRLRPTDEPNFKLVQSFEAQGSSRKEAIENAQMVTYGVTFTEDSIITFDSNIQFKENSKFRAQRLDMTLYVPRGSKFMMDDDIRHIIRNTIYHYGYEVSQMEDNVWTFDDLGMKCLTCTAVAVSEYDRQLRYSDFQSLEISGAFKLNIEKGDEFQVLTKGDTRVLDNLRIDQDGDRLELRLDDDDYIRRQSSRNQLEVSITMPELTDLEIDGASKVYVNGFDGRELEASLSGAAFAKFSSNFERLSVVLTGASEIEFNGEGDELTADISAASYLNAYTYKVKIADVEAHGASSARLFVTESLTITETMASNVKYRGDAQVVRERGGI